MARRFLTWAQSWGAFALAGFWLGGLALTHFWPTWWWFEVRRVAVFDAVVGADIVLDVDRVIHRAFEAEWSVLVRRYVGGGWTVDCAARGVSDYRPDAVLPDPLTLEWWTAGQCAQLDAGRYMISTIWTISGGVALPDKVIQTVSNVFTVTD